MEDPQIVDTPPTELNIPLGGAGEPQTPPKDEVKELKEKNEQLFARTKKAEEDFKEYKKSHPDTSTPKVVPPINAFDLARTVSTLKDFSPDEISLIEKFAKADDTTPEEIVKRTDVMEIITLRREKVAKDKAIPAPSSPFGSTLNTKPVKEMTSEEHAKFEKDFVAKKKSSGV